MPWRIKLFGALQVQREEDRTLSGLSLRRVGALLAALILRAPHPVPREELTELLWPDEAPDVARNRLRVLLSSLRRQLEPLEPAGADSNSTLLTADRTAVGLVPGVFTSDYHDFLAALQAAKRASSESDTIRHLEAASALYGGELLAGYYDEWILTERTRLAARRYQVLRELVRRLRNRDCPEQALEYARLAAEVEPLDDEAQNEVSDLLRQIRQMPQTPQIKPMAPEALPIRLTRFFGRDHETAQLCTLLAPDGSARLVTLLGPGGMGKTRLAVETAERLSAAFRGHVYFVGLSEMAAPLEARQFGLALARALHLPPTRDTDPFSQVIAVLGQAPTLLVLDNLEQILPEVAPQIEHLLREAPSLRCLLTSRRSAGIEGEQEIVLQTLSLPTPDADIATLSGYPGIALFVDRVRLVRSEFALTSKNADDVIALCRVLEGLPLAIELAAVRARVLTPAEMRRQTGALLPWLVDTQGGKNIRHRSLRTTLEWSYRLMSAREQRFFQALSVFRGGFSASAADSAGQEGASTSGETLTLLETLRASSLLTVTETGSVTEPATTRFGMLETVREFGGECLRESGNADQTRQHHLLYFADAFWEPTPTRYQTALEAANFREALAFGLRSASGTSERRAAFRLAERLFDHWESQGLWREGLDFLQRVARLDEAAAFPAAKVALLRDAGILADLLGEYDEAGCLSEAGLRLAQEIEDERGRAGCLQNLGNVAFHRDDYAGAGPLLEEALHLYEAVGDDAGNAICRVSLAGVAFFTGDHTAALSRLGEALTLYRRWDDRQGIATALVRLGNIRRNQNYFSEAQTHLAEALEIFQALGYRPGIAACLHDLGLICGMRGDSDQAQARFTDAQTQFQAIGARRGVHSCLINRAAISENQGDITGAIRQYREVREACLRTGDRRNLAGALFGLGLAQIALGHSGEAHTCFTDGLRIEEEIGSRGGIANCRAGLGHVAMERGDFAEAASQFAEAHQIYEAMDVRAGVVEMWEAQASLAQRENRHETAVRLAASASVLRREIGYTRSYVPGRLQTALALLREAMGEDAFTRAWRERESDRAF